LTFVQSDNILHIKDYVRWPHSDNNQKVVSVSDIVYNRVTALPKKQGNIQRPRVDSLLTEAIEHTVVAVTAGAGYGKTQAVSMFINSTQARAAWLSLSKLDNYPTRFWNVLIHAIPFQNRETFSQFKQLGFPDSAFKFNQFLYMFAKEIYIGEQFILALDDFHVINNRSIIEFVENMTYANLEKFCIVVLSRTKINLNLYGLYTDINERQITAEDLCFTLHETREYLERQSIKFSQNELEKIHSVSEGWPLALYLVGLSVKKGKTVSGNLVAGAKPLIFDLIEKEIYSQYTQETQRVLVRLSLLENFSAGILKELTDTQPDIMLEIINANMFIQYNPYSEVYQFHHLFLEFLCLKQIQISKGEIKEVYLKAADWYAANGQLLDAVMYYKECGCHEKIWGTILGAPPARRPKEITRLLIDLLTDLPEPFIKRNPMTRVVRASLLHNNMELDIAIKDLKDLIEEYARLPGTEENRALLGEAYIVLALISLTQMDVRYVDMFKAASRYLPNGSSRRYNNIGIIDCNHAIIHNSPHKSEIDKMQKALFDAIPYASKAMHGFGQGVEYLAAAEVAYYTGDFAKAEENAFQSVYRGRQTGQDDVVCSAYFLLMRINMANGNYDAIVDYMRRLREHENNSESERFLGLPDIAEGWFFLNLGRPERVAGWLLDSALNDKVHPPISVGRDRHIRALYLLEERKYYELIAFLDQLDGLYRQKGLWFDWVSAQAIRCIAFYHIGNRLECIETLKSAYDIAQDTDFVMQFVEMGNHMRTVINAARQGRNHGISDRWLDGIYTKASTYAKRQAYAKAKYKIENELSDAEEANLTNREIDILRNLCQGLTREEIAQCLSISVNTVKSALQNIYGKLGALNSADAVRIAAFMKII